MASITILHPGIESPAGAAAPKLAPRVASFAGKRIGVFDNSKVNAKAILKAVARRLQERHGAGEVREYGKTHAGETGAKFLPTMMDWKPDIVLTGIGD